MIGVGDPVRLVSLPEDLDRLPPYSRAVFYGALGGEFIVRDVDQHGRLEIWVAGNRDADDVATADAIWVDADNAVPLGQG